MRRCAPVVLRRPARSRPPPGSRLAAEQRRARRWTPAAIGVEDQVQLTDHGRGAARCPTRCRCPRSRTSGRGGPSVSTQMSFVNGRMSQARSWTYVLQPHGGGARRGGAGQGAVRRRASRRAPAIPIEVVAGSVKPARPPRRTSTLRRGSRSTSILSASGAAGPAPSRSSLVEASPSRTSLHVGEPLLLTYYLYTQTSVSGPPVRGGAAVSRASGSRTCRGRSGRQRRAGHRRRRRLPPLPDPAEAALPHAGGPPHHPRGHAEDRDPRARASSTPGAWCERSTKPVDDRGEADPRRARLQRGGGPLQGHRRASTATVALGEAATLRFKVEGSGNLKWIDRAPEVKVPGAKVYPPQAKSDLQAGARGDRGLATWEFVVVPADRGNARVPSLAFSYFDPAGRARAASETAPLPLQVEGGTARRGRRPPLPLRRAAARAGGPLPLRTDLDAAALGLPGPRRPARSPSASAVVLLLHARSGRGRRLAGCRRRPAGRPPPRAACAARCAICSAWAADGMSKEAAAALIEKTLHDVFGSLDGDDSERGARGARSCSTTSTSCATRPSSATTRRSCASWRRAPARWCGGGREVARLPSPSRRFSGWRVLAAGRRSSGRPGRPLPRGQRARARAATTRRPSPLYEAAGRLGRRERVALLELGAGGGRAGRAREKRSGRSCARASSIPRDRAVRRDDRAAARGREPGPRRDRPRAAGRRGARSPAASASTSWPWPCSSSRSSPTRVARLAPGARWPAPPPGRRWSSGLVVCAVPVARAPSPAPPGVVVRRGAPLLDAASPTAEPWAPCARARSSRSSSGAAATCGSRTRRARGAGRRDETCAGLAPGPGSKTACDPRGSRTRWRPGTGSSPVVVSLGSCCAGARRSPASGARGRYCTVPLNGCVTWTGAGEAWWWNRRQPPGVLEEVGGRATARPTSPSLLAVMFSVQVTTADVAQDVHPYRGGGDAHPAGAGEDLLPGPAHRVPAREGLPSRVHAVDAGSCTQSSSMAARSRVSRAR